MSLKVAELYGELDLRTNKFDSEMSGVRGKLSRLGPIIAAAAVAGGIALAAGMYKGITAASDLNETISKSKVVFGEQADAVLSWSESSATAMGESQQAALEATATFGNLFVSMGMGEGVSSKMSMKLTQLAGDLASFNNIDPAEALDALRSGLVGETEPLRRLGVNMNDAELRAQALKMGLIASVKDGLSPATKAQAAYALIMGQTKTAQGDFARTSGGFANQMRILKAEITNLFASVGQYLLPVATEVVKGIRTIVSGVGPAIDKIKGFFSGGDASGMASKLTEPFKGIGAELSPIFADIGAKLGELWTVVGPAIQTVAGFLADVLGKAFTLLRPVIVEFGKTVSKQIGYVVSLAQFIKEHWGTIVQFVGPIFKIISTIISTAFKVIVDIVRAALAIMRGDWDGAKAAMTRIAQNLSKAIVTVLRALGQLVVAILRAAWAAVKAATSAAWNGIKGAVSAGASAVVSYVRGLPGRIVGALGNLGSLLYGAGRSIISGLLNGIRDSLSAVWDEVSSIAGKIKDLKGPIEYDRVLLRPAGQAIIGGLMAGIDDQLGALYAQVGSISPRLALAASPHLSLGVAGGASAPVTNVAVYLDSEPVAARVRVQQKAKARRDMRTRGYS